MATSKKFPPGTKLICIMPPEIHAVIKKGEIYTVLSCQENGYGTDDHRIRLEGNYDALWWSSRRFRLATYEEINPNAGAEYEEILAGQETYSALTQDKPRT